VGEEPLVRLPDKVVLSRDEVARVIFALDSAEEEPAIGPSTRRRIAAARILLTSKLWIELADLLDDDGEE